MSNDVFRTSHASNKAWLKVKRSRCQSRLKSKDFLAGIFDTFQPLYGNRVNKECSSIQAGLASLNRQSCVVIAQCKGTDTASNIECNFGMATPHAYRKAIRAMRLAEKFRLPLITFIDTPGAGVSVDDEHYNQSGAISECLATMAQLKTPTLACVIGEGMSGGGIALSLADKILMLADAIYSVISPEGCASILFKDPNKAPEIAMYMGITAEQLKQQNLIDTRVPEHDDSQVPVNAMSTFKQCLENHLNEIMASSLDNLISQRYQKWSTIG